MKKRILPVALIFTLLFSAFSIQKTTANSDNFYTDYERAVSLVGNLYAITRESLYQLNLFVYDKYGLISYNVPHGNFFETPDGRMTNGSKQGEYQYLGYDFDEKEMTNDLYHNPSSGTQTTFTSNYNYYWGRPPSGTSVTWLEVSGADGTWKNKSDYAKDYIKNTPFYDDDHPTQNESSTGYTLSSLLGSDVEGRAYIQSLPTTSNDGSIKLMWKAVKSDGTVKCDYNTIFIPRANLEVTPTPPPGPTVTPTPAPTSGTVTLSYSLHYGSDLIFETYQVSIGDKIYPKTFDGYVLVGKDEDLLYGKYYKYEYYDDGLPDNTWRWSCEHDSIPYTVTYIDNSPNQKRTFYYKKIGYFSQMVAYPNTSMLYMFYEHGMSLFEITNLVKTYKNQPDISNPDVCPSVNSISAKKDYEDGLTYHKYDEAFKNAIREGL